MSTKPPAFISYAREDSDFVRRLAADLKDAGANVWLDELDIRPGKKWDREVELALTQCRELLVILSVASVASDNVMDEVTYALDEQRTVIPVIASDCQMPYRLRRLQHLDFRKDYQLGLKALLRELVGEVKAATVVAPAASAQENAGGGQPSPATQPAGALAPAGNTEQAALRGAGRLATAIRATLGPLGRDVVINRKQGEPVVTKDTRVIVRELELKDASENIGTRVLRGIVTKTDQAAHDGCATAAILAYAIIQGAMSSEGGKRLAVTRGLQKAVPMVVEQIKKLSRPISGGVIEQVGTACGDGDSSIGNAIGEAMKKVGRDGVILVEESKGMWTELVIVEGMQFDRGYLSPYFVTDAERAEAILEDCYILLHERKITELRSLLPLLEQVARAGKPLLVIASETEGEALATLVVNKQRGTLNSCAVKAPGFGDRRKAILEDIAILTNGRAILEESGIKLEDVKLGDLGRAKLVKVDKDNTTIVDGAGETRGIEGRIKQIRRQIDETTSDYDHQKLQERLAKLVGGVAVIKVGAGTEAEMKEKRARYERALYGARAAVEEGVVPGGGVALLRASRILVKTSLKGDEQQGAAIAMRACEQPFLQIAASTGEEEEDAILTVLKSRDVNYGLDAVAHEWKDLMAGGIVDPTRTVCRALEVAAAESVAFLNSDMSIFEA